MDIILIRHAESIANTQGIYQGQTYDTDLSNLGKKQADALARAIAKLGAVEAVYASPLKRTWQTAQKVSQIAMLPEPVVENRLIETNHGLWEGLSVAEIQEQYPELLMAWKKEPATVTFPEGENLQQMLDRCLDSLNEIAARH